MTSTQFDVLVVGGGAAGLTAALEVALTGKSVGLLEAKARCGGRILTIPGENGKPVELGAEFVHGNLPLTRQLLKAAGATTVPVRGSLWQYRNGSLCEQEDFIENGGDLQKKFGQLKKDIPVAQFLRTCLAGEQYAALRVSIESYVQGYYAADPAHASTAALRDEWQKSDGEQYRVNGGYQTLIAYLETRCREKGVRFFFCEPAKTVRWKRNRVEVSTGKNEFTAKKAVIAVAVGVLKAGRLVFVPALDSRMAAVQHLGFGHVQKLVLEFAKPFWVSTAFRAGHNRKGLGFLFSQEEIPTWWTQYPSESPVLTGWLGGPPALALRELADEAWAAKALLLLSRIFGADVPHLTQLLRAVHRYNWSADPDFGGAYSYEVVNGAAAIQTLLQPAEDTVYFAGEGLHSGPEIGTVEAALATGRDAAHRLVAQF